MRGNADASTTRKPLVPCTSKLLFKTPTAATAPIGHVHDAWELQAVFLMNSRS
jgi:hypothetical protein